MGVLLRGTEGGRGAGGTVGKAGLLLRPGQPS